MNSKRGWRKGFGFAQIMAMIVVVIPTSIYMITILFDYWTAMQLDNHLKLMSHRAISAMNNASDLSSMASLETSMKTTGNWDVINGLCPKDMTLSLISRTDMPKGQTQVVMAVTYDKFNHLDVQELSSKIISYSYNDQNGSFKMECK